MGLVSRCFMPRARLGPTGNGLPFGNRCHPPGTIRHPFDHICPEHGIEHGFTQPSQLCFSNGQVKRRSRTIAETKGAAVLLPDGQRTQETPAGLFAGLPHAKRSNTLRGLTPRKYGCARWQKNAVDSNPGPVHFPRGLCIYSMAHSGHIES